MSNKPRAEIRDVTPEWAMAKMETHSKQQAAGEFRQRRVNEKTVKMYADDMRAGNWTLTGQGISFDEQGRLLDGQHRLAAIVKSGVTVKIMVMWDLPVEVNGTLKTIDTFDTGKKRSLANQLQIEGVQYYAEVSTASRILVMLASGMGNTKQAISNSSGIATANLMGNHLLNLINILKKGGGVKKYKGAILAPLALLRAVEPDTADLFATEFNEMTNLGKTSPVLHFQKFLERPTHVMRGNLDWSMKTVTALSSALYLYSRDERCDIIKGNWDHVEWLLKLSKNAVTKIREMSGMVLTMEELKQKG